MQPESPAAADEYTAVRDAAAEDGDMVDVAWVVTYYVTIV